MTSFNLKYLREDPVSKYSHILRDWGLDFDIFIWRWGTMQPITVPLYEIHWGTWVSGFTQPLDK